MCIVIMCSKIDICSADAVKRNWDLNYCTYQTVVIAYCYRMISTKAIITPVCVLGRGSDGMLLAHSLTEFERDTNTSGEFNSLKTFHLPQCNYNLLFSKIKDIG